MTVIKQIAALLDKHRHTAIELRQALGLTHEVVYMALVRMEAQGLAVVVPEFPGLGGRAWEAGWMAAPAMSADGVLSGDMRAAA